MSVETNWTEAELQTAVEAYVQVMAWEKLETPFSPTAFHRSLAKAALATRSEGAIGRRMSNISAVLAEAGEAHSNRYKPSLTHVGSNTSKRILRIFRALDREAARNSTDPQKIAARSAALLSKGAVNQPHGNEQPGREKRAVTSFSRCPQVVAWVLQEANGVCDACGQTAPFVSSSGHPFLEVHHVTHLAEGGPDVVANAVAVCPNCHKRLHHSIDAEKYRRALLKKIKRLDDYSAM